MNDGQPTKPAKSEEIKAQIDALQAGKKYAPATETKTEESAQSTSDAPSKTDEDQTASTVKGEQAASVKEVAPAEKVSADKRNSDVIEWARKKGIKDEETALRSLRELEKELHKRSFESKKVKPVDVPRGTPDVPSWQPTPQFQPQQPYYQQPPLNRKEILAREAENYNMTPEDFERVLKVANDISQLQVSKLQDQFKAEMEEIKKETRRATELRELMQDPVFTNDEVQFEIHKVLEENPDAFIHEPAPYTYAFKEAQVRLARKYIKGERSVTEVESDSRISSKPPTEGNRSTAHPTEINKDQEVAERFYKSKPDEQRKILNSLGAIKTI